MNKYSILFSALLFFFGAGMISAQKAVIAGKVIDQTTGETLIGAAIKVSNAAVSTGAVTDFDGNYTLSVAPGTYTVSCTYASYQTYTVKDFIAIVEVTNMLDVAMSAEDVALTEIVVTATQVRNTDASLISLQRRSISIQDGISSQQISRTGVSNAADAMKQVTGAVVEGGRFIVMRGLGDRYSITQLNGITMPSTDPYRNSTSLDLIPSQIIENIVTIKTFTPDMPGNFSGGLVNVTTKTFPDKFNLYFSASTSYNTQASLNDKFLGHGEDSGKYDWLGYDDGGRELPEILSIEDNRKVLTQDVYIQARDPKNPNGEQLRSLLNETSHALSNVFTPTAEKSPLNQSFNFSIGDNLKLGKNRLGYTVGVIYSRDYQHYENGEVNTFVTNDPINIQAYQALKETKSVETPHVGGFLSLAYKIGPNNAINFNTIYNNDTEKIGRSQAGLFDGQVSTPGSTFNTQSLEFVQRSFTSNQLSGTHTFAGLKGAEISWSGSITNSFQKEPDTRYFAYLSYIDDEGNNAWAINDAEFRPPFHFFRDLKDNSYEGKIDITLPFLRNADPSSTNCIKFGGLYNRMERTFGEYQFSHQRHGGVPASIYFNNFRGDFDAFFDYNNFGVIDTSYYAQYPDSIRRYTIGYHYVNQVNNKNFYDGEQTIAAGYLMGIYNLTTRLKLIAGVRLESTDLQVVSRDTSIEKSVIDLTDPLYSLNLIYSLNKKSNFRLAATQTLARPNMREIAPFAQFDTKNGFFNNGAPGLKRTLIQNYDIRYELYPQLGELFAVSLFYKEFENPILRRFDPTATIPTLGYTNIDKATVFGAEIELRKNLGFIHEKVFKDLYFATNIALIKSEYKIPADELESSQNIDSTYDITTRPFQSQSPYIVNAMLSYVNPDNGLEASLSYNIAGRKLYNIALAATPDVYEEPVNLLNFNISKKFANHYQLTFSARNILNPLNKKTIEFNDQTLVTESFRLGTTYGLGFSYFIR